MIAYLKSRARCAVMLPVCFALSACGGEATSGGGGVASTGVTYTKLADMSGDRTFQTGGVHYNVSASGLSNIATDNFGSGASIAYTASSDSYTLTAPGGGSTIFGPADFKQAQSAPNVPNMIVYQKTTSAGTEMLGFSSPAVNGVNLSYTLIGSWLHAISGGNPVLYLAVGGSPTVASDMPKIGTANYAVAVGGLVSVPNGSGGATNNLLSNSATGTFSANFGTGQITNSIHLLSSTGADFGTINGTGAIASNSSAFTGTFAGATSGGFSGSFFGPQAAEMGMSWGLSTGSYTAVGTMTGFKQ